MKFAIIGDVGIHAKVGDDFWSSIKERMAEHFRQSLFTDGLIEGITEGAKALQQYFPHTDADRNELSYDIEFGK